MKRTTVNVSLRAKILIVIIGIVLLLGLSIIAFVKTTLAKRLHAELAKRGVSIAKNIAQGSTNFILTEHSVDIQIFLNNVLESEEDIVYSFVQGTHGEILAHTFHEGFPADLKNVNVIGRGEDHRIQNLETENGAMIDIAVPVLRGDAGTVHLGISKDPVRRSVNKITGLIIMTVFAVLLSGIGIAVIFANKITAPLYELVETAHAVGSGELGRKVHVRTNDEIGRLGTVFNQMTEDLSNTVVSRDALEMSHKSKKAMLDSMPYGVIVIGRDKKIRSANQAALSLMGYASEAEVAGMVCNKTLCPAQEGKCPILDLKEKVDHSERVLLTRDGRRVPILKTVVPIDLDGEDVLLEAVIDITERKRAEEQIHVLAYYDSLTGLPNRSFYRELLARAITHAERHNEKMAVVFIDLDYFKRINDTLGHSVGDQLLRVAAERLTKCVRRSDTVARPWEDEGTDIVSRLGGDEFIVVLSELAHNQDAARVANRILAELSRPFTLSGNEVIVSASIGIALYPADGKDAESLLKNADAAMYHAKNQGRNAYQFYTHSMNESALERLTLENELRKALERDEFQLYYQPKLNLKNRKIVGLEALLRWKHPERGLVSPGKFIPVAEEAGLIVSIGEWVLRAACSQNRAWQKAGHQPVSVAVNLSSRQFEQRQLIETVTRALRDADLDPGYLALEITESAIMKNPEKASAMLQQLKTMGIPISIDDFGTGYSSLSYLRRFPVDELKIDRSFIMNIATSPDDASIAGAIIAMAHSLKLRVVAEGVETEEQLAFLRGLGCDEAQGYLFSRPVPAEECVRLLSTASSCT